MNKDLKDLLGEIILAVITGVMIVLLFAILDNLIFFMKWVIKWL